jgi:uncharacterized repeat protein (TIGR03806 family)
MGYKFIPLLLLLAACSGKEPESFSKNNMEFAKTLSEYNLFKGKISDLVPNDSVQVLELSYTLFTDYTEKQRLLKLPPGIKMIAKGDGLPDFPNGTILAKTFYYSAVQTKGQQKIIETRILQKYKGNWNIATYQWNDAQTEANLLTKGGTVSASIELPDGSQKDIKYKIPTVYDCYDCHRSNNSIIPIGPKLRNLNIDLLIEGKPVSQLQLLKEKGLLTIKQHEQTAKLPSYKDANQPLEKRARAYFEINCAHCHNPQGFAGAYSLDLRYENEFENTGIFFNKWNIEHRMTIRDMPRLGTTIVDNEGLKLIQQYLAGLKKK